MINLCEEKAKRGSKGPSFLFHVKQSIELKLTFVVSNVSRETLLFIGIGIDSLTGRKRRQYQNLSSGVLMQQFHGWLIQNTTDSHDL